MKYWANKLFIAPAHSRSSSANYYLVCRQEFFHQSMASSGLGLELSRRLFLPVLLSSFLLAVGWCTAQASPEGDAPGVCLALHLQYGQDHSPVADWPDMCSSRQALAATAILSSRLSFICSISPASPVKCSNGAILAYQVSASSKDIPTARSRGATISPRREGSITEEIQICTQGYPVASGIPNPFYGRRLLADKHSRAASLFPGNQIRKAS